MINSRVIVGKFSVQTVSVALQAIIQLATIMIMSRLLSKVDFGLFAVASGIRIMALTLSEAGIGSAVVQAKTVDTEFLSTAFWCAFVTGLLLAVIVFLFSSMIANFNNEMMIKNILKCISVTFVLNGISAVPRAILQRNLQIFELMITKTIPMFISYLLIGVYLALNNYGVWSMVAALVMNSILRTILLFIFSKYKVIFCFSKESWKKIMRFAFGMTSAGVLNNISSNIDKLLLGGILSVSILGAFNRVMELVAMLVRYPFMVLDMLLFPLVSKIQDDSKKIFTVYVLAIDVFLVFATIFALYLFCYSNETIRFILGTKWEFMDGILKIISLLLISRLTNVLSSIFLRSMGYVYRIFLIRVAACLISLAGIVIGSRWNLTGVAWGVVLSNFMISAIMVTVTCRALKRSPAFLLKSISRALMIGGIFFLIQKSLVFISVFVDVDQGWLNSISRLAVSSLLLLAFFFWCPQAFGVSVNRLYLLVLERYLGTENVFYKRHSQCV